VELAGGNPTRFCSSLCKVLSKLDPQHCEKEAR
jgi:hypothetical protein